MKRSPRAALGGTAVPSSCASPCPGLQIYRPGCQRSQRHPAAGLAQKCPIPRLRLHLGDGYSLS